MIYSCRVSIKCFHLFLVVQNSSKRCSVYTRQVSPLAVSAVASSYSLFKVQTIDDVNCQRVTSPQIIWYRITANIILIALKSVQLEKDLAAWEQHHFGSAQCTQNIRSQGQLHAMSHDLLWIMILRVNNKSQSVYTDVCPSTESFRGSLFHIHEKRLNPVGVSSRILVTSVQTTSLC